MLTSLWKAHEHAYHAAKLETIARGGLEVGLFCQSASKGCCAVARLGDLR
jgi:hypothetical protein